MKCVSCGKSGSWFCCDAEYSRLLHEVRSVFAMMGEDESEGPLILTASKILEAYERVENTTSLGKAVTMARARELLAEVEDHFKYTPMCPQCKEHKMELIVGDPIQITCTGGCEF